VLPTLDGHTHDQPVAQPHGIRGDSDDANRCSRRHRSHHRLRTRFDSGGGNGQFEPFINATFGFKQGEVGFSYAYERTNFGDLGGGVLPIDGGGGNTVTLKRRSSLGRTASAAEVPAPMFPPVLGLAGTSTTFSSNYFVLHAKYRLYEDDNFAVAVGAHYYNFGRSQGASLGNTGSLYATGSYDLLDGDETRAQLHLGLLGQRTSGGGVASQTVVRPFVGAEVFAPDSQLSLAADYLAKNKDAASAYALALRFQPDEDTSQRVGGELGVGRQAGGTKYFASLTYRFRR